MLSLILALVAAEPSTTAQPVAQPVSEPAARVAKAKKVTCKWVVSKGGIAREVCATGNQWRDDQIERQQRVDEFQRRQLTISPR
jgi:hypothetical protein